MTTKRTRDNGPDCTCLGSERENRGDLSTRSDAHYDECPRAAWNDAGRPPLKRTHGPCTCFPVPMGLKPHHSDCPSLYPAQQEPDALTKLVRYVRASTLHEVEKEEALALLSEAREEQRRAAVRAKNEGLEDAAKRVEATCGAPSPCSCDEHFWAESFRAMKGPEP